MKYGSFFYKFLIAKGALALLLLNSACVTYYYDLPSEEYLKKTAVSDKTLGKKIALVGFYPLKTTRYGNTFTVTLDYEKSMKGLLKIGKPVVEIPSRGFEKGIPSERVSAFRDYYLETAKRSGMDEMSDVFGFDGDDIKLKKRNVDFYLVGVHGPAFAERTGMGWLYGLGTLITSTLSLGLLPYVVEHEVWSEFRLYDNKLNLVKTWKKNRKVVMLQSYFVDGPYQEIFYDYYYAPGDRSFEKDVSELHQDLKLFIKK